VTGRGERDARRTAPAPGWLRELGRAVSWHRRLLAAGLLAGSVALTISAVSPGPPATVPVLAARQDLPGGTTLRPQDLRVVRLPPETVPEGAARGPDGVTGRVLASPVRAGEPITDVRLVGRSLLDGYGERLVAAPVRIADTAAARLLRSGDVVDVLAATAANTGAALLVAAGVRVVTVPAAAESAFGDSGLGEGALVVLATSSDTAARLAAAAVTSRLSVTIHGT
jgi:Flp pilus assembly protein CpaB